MNRASLVVAALLLSCSALSAQTLSTISTPFNSNNGQQGNLFDVVATNDISVHGFDVNIAGNGDFEVYALDGASWTTDPTNAGGAWRLVGSFAGVVSAGTGLPTRLGQLTTCVDIPAGTTTAFYVTFTGAGTMNYTNGTAVGNVLSSNADLSILEGAGLAYPFGGNFQPRNWNGGLYYFPGLTAGVCLPLPPVPGGDYQQNGANFQLDVDGVQSNGFNPAISTAVIGNTQSVNFTGVAGSAFETAFSVGGSLIPNALVLPSGIINVDLATSSFLNGGVVPSFAPFAGTFSLPVSLPVPLTIVGQAAFIDPSAPAGLAITQGVQAEWILQPGPTGDDSSVAITLPFPFEFFGTTYNDISVISNGRVQFGTGLGDTDFSPSLIEALGDEPFAGYWTDLNPAAAGSISLSQPFAAAYRIDYNGVEYFGAAGAANTFSIILDGATNTVSIDGLSGIVDNPGGFGGGDAAFFGASIGILGATDAGPSAFAIGGSAPTVAPTDMIYEFFDGLTPSRAPSIVAGLNAIDILSLGAGGGALWLGR